MRHGEGEPRGRAAHVRACCPDDSAVKRGDGHTVGDESSRSGTLESFQYGICEGEQFFDRPLVILT